MLAGPPIAQIMRVAGENAGKDLRAFKKEQLEQVYVARRSPLSEMPRATFLFSIRGLPDSPSAALNTAGTPCAEAG